MPNIKTIKQITQGQNPTSQINSVKKLLKLSHIAEPPGVVSSGVGASIVFHISDETELQDTKSNYSKNRMDSASISTVLTSVEDNNVSSKILFKTLKGSSNTNTSDN